MEHLSEHELKIMSAAWQRGWCCCCDEFFTDRSVPVKAVQVVRGKKKSFDPYKQELDRRQAEVEMSLVERNAEVAVGN